MQPTITRETLIERRAPTLRWSAVFAGAACSVGFWMLLQLLGIGIGLAAVDRSGGVASLYRASTGTTVWSLVSPLIAMFLGGWVTGKLAQSYDRKLAGAHGLVMWSITSILGFGALIWIVAVLAAGATRAGVAIDATGRMAPASADEAPATDAAPAPALDTANVDDVLGPINQRLSSQGKPAITPVQLRASLRGVARTGMARGDFDQELLVDQLVAHTRLSRADAADVERQLEARLGNNEPHGVEHRVERQALAAVDAAGKALTVAGLSLLLSLIAAVAGAVLATHRPRRGGKAPERVRGSTEPGFAPPVEPTDYSTALPMAGPATPVIPPHDITP